MSFIDSYNPHLLDGVQHVHFIGCGGSGTYPLIQILHSRGLADHFRQRCGRNQDHQGRARHGRDSISGA